MKHSRYIYGLAAGHLLVDFNQGALAALLPILIATYHFNYAIAATLVFAMNLVSSIVQPLFGYLSDHRQTSGVIVWAILIAGIGFCFLGWVSDYSLLILGVLVCGLGIAAYHPDAAKLVNGLAFQKKGRAMSLFSFGGNLGFAIGPIILTFIVNQSGIHGITFLLIPTVLIALILVLILYQIQQTSVETPLHKKKTESVSKQRRDSSDWRHFSILSVTLFGRSIVFYGLNTFLTLYWIHILKQTNTSGSIALSLLFIVGSIGTLLGGRLADQFGYTIVIKSAFVGLPLLLLALSLTRNVVVANLILLPLGLLVFMPYSAMVILGQRYLPQQMGLASGVTLGLAVSVGGIMSPLLGLIADATNLVIVLQVLAVIAIIPAVAAFGLTNNANFKRHTP